MRLRFVFMLALSLLAGPQAFGQSLPKDLPNSPQGLAPGTWWNNGGELARIPAQPRGRLAPRAAPGSAYPSPTYNNMTILGLCTGCIQPSSIGPTMLTNGAAAENIGPLFGDLSGQLPNAKVIALQGLPVDSTPPVTGYVLGWDGFKWTAIPMSGGGGGGIAGPPSSTIGFLPTWQNPLGTALGVGLPVATGGVSTVLMTTAAGLISSGVLPFPTTLALGGVKATTPTLHQWISGITNLGQPTLAQPACADLTNSSPSCSVDTTNASNILSGVLSAARLPLISSAGLAAGAAAGNIGALTGDVTGFLPTAKVTGLQGFPIDAGTPTPGFVLGWNGSVWSAVPGGAGGIAGPGSSIIGFIPTWNATTGASLGQGLAVGTGGVNSVLMTLSTGLIASSVLPPPTTGTLGGTKSAGPLIHEWVNAIDTTGLPQLSRPACADLSNGAASCSIDTTNAANIASGILPAARLPNPAPSTLGGVESFAGGPHLWISSISLLGVPNGTQPAFSDLIGQVGAGQMLGLTQGFTYTGNSLGQPTPTSVGSMLDVGIGATANGLMLRGSTGWGQLVGVANTVLTANPAGALGFTATLPLAVQNAIGIGNLSGQLAATQLAAGVAATNIGVLGGDLSGSTLPNPVVVALNGVALQSTPPTIGQLLGFSGSSWGPVNPPTTGINALVGAVTAGPGSGSQAATISPTGVVAGSYVVGTNCWAVAGTGQITSITAGPCGGGVSLGLYGGGSLGLYGGGTLGLY